MKVLTFKATTHKANPARIGAPISAAAMESVIDKPGPVEVKTIGVDWEAPITGLLNIKHPKAAATGVSGERDGRGIFAAVEKRAVGVQRVVGPGRERVFGGEPVVQREGPEPGPDHQVRCQLQRGLWRAEDVAAAMKVQDRPGPGVHLPLDHERGPPGQLGRRRPHPGRNRERPHERGEPLAHLLDRHRTERLRRLAQHLIQCLPLLPAHMSS